jgi:hypothetical protein
MKKYILAAVLVLVAGSAQAASYTLIGGAIVDPIQSVFGGNHSYSGNNLEPVAFLGNADLFGADLSNANLNVANLFGADLGGADLSNAFLRNTDLFGADLSNANLIGASLKSSFLFGANLTNANLSSADLGGADLNSANLSSANLSSAILLNAVGLTFYRGGAAFYDINTDFTGTGFDPVAAGWTLVPEPSTALLLSLGLIGLSARKWLLTPYPRWTSAR